MGLGIIIPLVLVAIAVPVAFTWAKKTLKDGQARTADEVIVAPSARLTSNALRDLPRPPGVWSTRSPTTSSANSATS